MFSGNCQQVSALLTLCLIFVQGSWAVAKQAAPAAPPAGWGGGGRQVAGS
jgi:hypothetical protein